MHLYLTFVCDRHHCIPGEFIGGTTVPPPNSLDDMETTLKDWALDTEERDLFLRFMNKMLQWDPKDRQMPKQLLQDEWIKKLLGCDNVKSTTNHC